MRYILKLISKQDKREKEIELSANNAEGAIEKALILGSGNWTFKTGSLRTRQVA